MLSPVLCLVDRQAGWLLPLAVLPWPLFCFTDYMAHLVEVQHERGASGGQTFHSLLTASLPPRRGTAPPLSPHVTVRAGLLLASMVFPCLCQPYWGALMWTQGPALLSGHSPWQDTARSLLESLEATCFLFVCRQHRGS